MGQGRVAGVMVVAVLFTACSSPRTAPAPAAAPVAVQETLSPRDLAQRALELFDRKPEESIPLLTEAANAYPEVAPFLRLRIAEVEAARENVPEAIAILSEIVAIGNTTATTVARLRLPALYARINDRASTEAALHLAMQVPIDELSEGDFVNMAAALAKAGRNDLATSTRMHLLTNYPQSRFTEQTFGHVQDELAKLPAAERIALAAKLARYSRYDQALTLLPADAPEARSTRIRALFNSRKYDTLLAETSELTLTDPALMLTRARAAWRADQPQIFLAGLDAVEKQFPTSKEATEARILRAKYYSTDVIDYARSVEDLNKAVAAGAGDENLWNLGWTYTLWGRYDDALKTFDRYIRTYVDGDWKTNSLFWSAKIHDRFGRTAERDAKIAQLVAEYPFSYYAYRAKELWSGGAAGQAASSGGAAASAAESSGPEAGPAPQARLQARPGSAVSGGAAAAPAAGAPAPAPQAPRLFPDLDAELAKISEPRLNVVRALQDIGLDRAAAREMKVLAEKYSDNSGVQFMLADVYVRGGEPFKANGVLQRRFREFVRHGGANVPQRFWQILFPLAYWDTIRAEAERRGHDPYLLASIIRQESGFEPTTVSNAGAVGLMQIMPEEASRIGAAGGLGEVTRQDLFDPQKNIAVGAAEYSQKLAVMNGNPTLAIAAYNAGETAVQDWVARTPLDDMDVFIESIPYAETRLYVKTVTRNRHEYRRIYQ
jgi:soluble lytic murein transglycosylase-like protein/tetratricopeptide (TPR) repeat protein